MAKITGRRLTISAPRRWVGDLMHLSRDIPLISIEHTMQLRGLAQARSGMPTAPSWAAIFMKALGLVAGQHPELRRAYMSWPWAHFYEADQSIASLTIARDFHGEEAVFFGLISEPDRRPLAQIHQAIQEYKQAPVESIKYYQRLLRYSRYPRFLRRFIWAFGYHISGKSRAKNFGTFGLSTTAGMGATLNTLISPLSATLTYGPISEEGVVSVRLVFDHRVFDGATAARILNDLETILNNDMVSEVWIFRGTMAEVIL
ncbi:MAG: 2-oxo acid dehydrogenase subunit E2 [Fimbriiglobus sp.]